MNKIKIFLTKGKGEGITKEAAYCRALKEAGLINLNLIHLTSVLPSNFQIVRKKPKFSHQDFGKRIYVIISEIRTEEIGKTICAGLGWLKEKNENGYGLVVQIQGENEEKVKKEIKDSLKEIAKSEKKLNKNQMNIVTEKIVCKNKPVCALVALVFNKIENWL